jgi:hypothetical protein
LNHRKLLRVPEIQNLRADPIGVSGGGREKRRALFEISEYINWMRSIFITFTVGLATSIPCLILAAEMGYSTPKPSSTASTTTSSTEGVRDKDGFLHRPNSTPATTPQVAIVQQPYNLGQAIYSGNYKFKKATATHSAEKAHRLTILQSGLPEAEKKKINPKELANHLSDGEMNAFEYYIQVRFGKFVNVAPSWAKEEPPIKVSYTK